MIDSMKSSIEKINSLDLAEFYQNGQEVIDRVKELTEIALKETKKYPFCPVRVLLLDF